MTTKIPESTKLTFDEYQKLSAETAVFPQVDAEMADACLRFLVSSSKVAGIIKKIYRDNNGVMSSEIKCKLETAMMVAGEDFDTLDFLIDQSISQTPGSAPNTSLVYPLLGLADEAGELIEKCLENDIKGAEKECGDIKWYSAQIDSKLGVTSGAIATDNLHKLFSRKERGVLKGSGDNR